MEFEWLAASRARLEFYMFKAEEADKKAADAEDVGVRETWAQIAQARRALAQRLSDTCSSEHELEA
jgi:hypothetical protein